MIGVVCKKGELGLVNEFFQLFKTPWELHKQGRYYALILSTGDYVPRPRCDALVIYSSLETDWDRKFGVELGGIENEGMARFESDEFPLYRPFRVFRGSAQAFLKSKSSGKYIGLAIKGAPCRVFRVGYDLFAEVGHLLVQGQPPELALYPTLEAHISLIRHIYSWTRQPLIEVPPSPVNTDFIVCLTHDVDFVGIRRHFLDHTMFGFLYRAIIQTGLRFLKGRADSKLLFRNLCAAMSLPLVHVGLREDFWLAFDRYLGLEEDLPSTFYFIPFKGMGPGCHASRKEKRRASKYDITDVSDVIYHLTSNGREVGVHGINAWRNLEDARSELRRVASLIPQAHLGVRMHWLYRSQEYQQILDRAGFDYDSTLGYNEAVGFYAGTSQAFLPPGAARLIELPMTLQDTSLFYSGRMGLSEEEAMHVILGLVRDLREHGGAMVINWHHRSLVPERCWDAFYARLIATLRTERTWFARGIDAVRWFRKRRSVVFERSDYPDGSYSIKASGGMDDGTPEVALSVSRLSPRSRKIEQTVLPLGSTQPDAFSFAQQSSRLGRRSKSNLA